MLWEHTRITCIRLQISMHANLRRIEFYPNEKVELLQYFYRFRTRWYKGLDIALIVSVRRLFDVSSIEFEVNESQEVLEERRMWLDIQEQRRVVLQPPVASTNRVLPNVPANISVCRCESSNARTCGSICGSPPWPGSPVPGGF